jgi:hypothetical protein
VFLRRHGDRSVALLAGNGQHRGDEAHVAERQPVVIDQQGLELVEPGLRRFIAAEFQRLLKAVDAGPEGAVDVKGRAAEVQRIRAPRVEPLTKRSQDAALADARLAGQQHHLPAFVLGKRPSVEQQPDLVVAAHQRCQSLVDGRFETAPP